MAFVTRMGDAAEPERRRALDWLREQGQVLERQVDLRHNPPGAPFAPLSWLG